MVRLKFFLSIIAMVMACAPLSARDSEHKPDNKTQEEPASLDQDFKEHFSITHGNIKVGGRGLGYTATAGNLIIKDPEGKPKASLFFVAYTKDGVKEIGKRPITFCTNGGPGSSAVWLHMGVFGPRRVLLDDDGLAYPPYQLVDNEYSLLDTTDLVFIDPVSTGYSRAAPGEDAKQFHGVEEDVKSIAEFIRLYLTRYHRWESPKFFAGESYGTTRAAALAAELHNNEHIYLNGLMLISSVLSFQSIDFEKGNDLPYLMFLPTYTATAWYHHRLPEDLQTKNLADVLKEVEAFVSNEYTLALTKGDKLTLQERDQIANKLSRYTGLSPTFIKNAHLRISQPRFGKELLRDQHRTVGRFDSRYTGIDSDAAGETTEYDPSADGIFGAFTATMNHYLTTELGWKTDQKYEILANVWPWSWGKNSNTYLDVSEELRDVMTRNPRLKVFVGNGYYDLATPYYATYYTFDHLGLDSSLRPNITMRDYIGGHMMYNYKPSMAKLKQDLSTFINSSYQ